MENEKSVFETSNMPRVDLNFMNKTHAEELELVIHLVAVIKVLQNSKVHDQNTIDQVNRYLNEWSEHTQDHFERENVLMREVGFPAYEVHKGEHDRVFAQMQSVLDMWKVSNDIQLLAEYVIEIWPQWFQQHVESMDTMTARFARMQGFEQDQIPEEANYNESES